MFMPFDPLVLLLGIYPCGIGEGALCLQNIPSTVSCALIASVTEAFQLKWDDSIMEKQGEKMCSREKDLCLPKDVHSSLIYVCEKSANDIKNSGRVNNVTSR